MKAADSDQIYLATLKALLKGDTMVDTNLVSKRTCSCIKTGGTFQRMKV